MLAKLKSKLKVASIFFKYFVFAGVIFTLIAGSFLIFLPKASAANCGNKTIGGGSLILSICDGLTISITDSKGVNITQATVGDTVNITASVTDGALVKQYGGVGKTFQIGICSDQASLPDCAQGSTEITSKDIGQAFSVTFPYQIGGVLSQAKSYSIGGFIDSGSFVGGEGNSTNWYIVGPVINLQVLAPASTGQAAIQVQQTGQLISGGVVKQFTINFSDGGTGKIPANYVYDCGTNGGQQTTSLTKQLKASNGVTTASGEFSCTYPFDQKSYSVTVKAVDSASPPNVVAILASPLQIQINGNEQSQGAGILNNASPASGLALIINEIFGFILGFLQELIYAIFAYLVAPIITAVLSIAVYKDSFVAVIYPGWIVIRNICNIFFILALIIIAMATLFRVESYQYKHLLIQLIIGALLINFSLVICQVVLGLADTVQAQFLGNNIDTVKTLASNLMLNSNSALINLFNTSAGTNGGNANAVAQNSDLFTGLVQAVFWLAMSVATLIVFAAIAMFLMVRIVALWLLIMVSPVAYVCGILPATAHYRSQWWQEFLKYAFFTPIMAFFLNLTAIMVNNAKTNNIIGQVASGASITSLNGIANLVTTLGSNILLLVFLIAAIKFAEQSGVVGASSITALAQKGVLAPGKLGFNRAARAYRDWTVNTVRGHEPKVSLPRRALFSVLNPAATIEGFKKRSEELQHASKAKAEAAGLEVAEQISTGGRKIIPRVLTHEKSEEDEFVKAYSHLNREGVVKTALDVFQMKDNDEGKAAKRGIIKLAMDKGYIDDIVQSGATNDTPEGRAFIKKLNEAGIVKQDARDWKKDWDKDENGNFVLKHDDRQRRAMYKAFFGEHGHIHDQAALRLITEEGEDSGKKTGHFEYLKDGKKNINTGMYELREDMPYLYNEDGELQYDAEGNPAIDTTKTEAIADANAGSAFAAGEVAKMGDRAQAAAAYHSFISLAKSGKIIDQNFIKSIARAIIGNPGFMQQRTAPNVIFGGGSMTPEQKAHLQTEGKVLINEETFKALKQIANVEGGGGVLASMYSMGTVAKKDDKLIGSIMNDNGIEFHVIGNDGVQRTQRVGWKPSQDEAREQKAASEAKNEDKARVQAQEEYQRQSLDLLSKIADKLK